MEPTVTESDGMKLLLVLSLIVLALVGVLVWHLWKGRPR